MISLIRELMIAAVICDWNRTLFEDHYELEFFKGVLRLAAKVSLKELRLRNLHNLWKTSRRCEAIFQNALRLRKPAAIQKKLLVEALESINQVAINKLPYDVFNKYLLEYAITARDRLDYRVLRPLMKIRQKHGVLLGIISSGCDVAIMETLKVGGCFFDLVKANYFEHENGKLKAFKLNIYDNKLKVLRAVLEEKTVELSRTVYIGDDWQDEECLRAVQFPVVSFLAPHKIRVAFQEMFNAYAPNSEEELEQWLHTISV